MGVGIVMGIFSHFGGAGVIWGLPGVIEDIHMVVGVRLGNLCVIGGVFGVIGGIN